MSLRRATPPSQRFIFAPPLEHLVDAFPEQEGNLGPPPPERSQNDLEHSEREHHIRRIEKVLDEENDGGDRHDGEQQAGNEGEEKQEDGGPEGDLRLRSREFLAAAAGACLGIPRIHMQPGTDFDVVAPAAKVAEQRFADSDAIAVVAIFHRI